LREVESKQQVVRFGLFKLVASMSPSFIRAGTGDEDESGRDDGGGTWRGRLAAKETTIKTKRFHASHNAATAKNKSFANLAILTCSGLTGVTRQSKEKGTPISKSKLERRWPNVGQTKRMCALEFS
jgi:hypothetical protein